MKKNKTLTTTIWIIIDILIVLVVAYFVVGYFNFFKIKKEQAPVFEGVTNKYEKDKGEVTVHDYKLYKIVEYKIPDKSITYSMKLWFMDDVK